MSNQVNSMNKGLTVKDLVTTGIFTALLFVFVLVGGVFFATNPVLTFFMPAGGGLLAGPIYLLLIAKVHKRWSLSIMGVIMGIIWFVTGMHWAFALGYLIMAIVADFVAGAGQYKSKKLNSLSYILFSLGGTGSYIVFFADPNGWAQTMLGNGTEQSYIDTMQATANTGILIANGADMKRWLAKLTNNNAQGEYYITDIIALAYQEGREIVAVHPQRLSEVEGVNNRLQLSRLERVYQSEQAEKLLLAGVMLRDPARFDLRGTLTHGRDVEIDTNVIIEGNVTLGHRVKIGTGCVIKNSVIGDDCEISPYTVVEDANLAAACTIGPFARLRPGAELLEGAHVGNFVEMKKARLGKGSKAGHLTYLGDAEIGDNVNIGAGTITCNYDGANKFKTIIGDDVFVGSDTQLVAPVTVGKGATIAAGTTVTRNVGENALAISRVPQTQKEGWRRPIKKK
mgnify:CR=1 FL=1